MIRRSFDPHPQGAGILRGAEHHGDLIGLAPLFRHEPLDPRADPLDFARGPGGGEDFQAGRVGGRLRPAGIAKEGLLQVRQG